MVPVTTFIFSAILPQSVSVYIDSNKSASKSGPGILDWEREAREGREPGICGEASLAVQYDSESSNDAAKSCVSLSRSSKRFTAFVGASVDVLHTGEVERRARFRDRSSATVSSISA